MATKRGHKQIKVWVPSGLYRRLVALQKQFKGKKRMMAAPSGPEFPERCGMMIKTDSDGTSMVCTGRCGRFSRKKCGFITNSGGWTFCGCK